MDCGGMRSLPAVQRRTCTFGKELTAVPGLRCLVRFPAVNFVSRIRCCSSGDIRSRFSTTRPKTAIALRCGIFPDPADLAAPDNPCLSVRNHNTNILFSRWQAGVCRGVYRGPQLSVSSASLEVITSRMSYRGTLPATATPVSIRRICPPHLIVAQFGASGGV